MVGRQVHLSRERVRQIEAKALGKLRKHRHLLTEYVERKEVNDE